MALAAPFFASLGAMGRGMGVFSAPNRAQMKAGKSHGGLSRGGQLAVAGAAFNAQSVVKDFNKNRRRGT